MEAGAVKPAPDLYLSVVDEMGISVQEAVALEDSPIGIAAAKAAGLFCIAVPNEVTSHTNLDAADLRIASLAELSLQKLELLLKDFKLKYPY
jgi:beta-phosphoglucomutase-like phosphatase (HAD superfamily)